MKKRPNFLIIMTDQQRSDTSGIPGAAVKAPHLEKLASRGIRFSNTFCTSPHCCPSRASFFSGLYPSGHGIWNNVLNDMAIGKDLNPGVRLWSEDLRDAGYENHYFGKWHVSGTENPEDRGWISHSVSSRSSDRNGLYWEDYEALAEEPEKKRQTGEIRTPGYKTMPLFRDLDSDSEKHDRIIVDEMLEELDRLQSADGPWCIYGGLLYPHDPYEVPREYLDRYPLESIKLPDSIDDEMHDKPIAYRMIRDKSFSQMDMEEKRLCMQHYYALCSYVDDQLGLILAKLKETGQEDDTVVIFCSDHGDYCGEHGLFCKGIPAFDSAYKVPLIINYPGEITKPGRSEEALVSLTDLKATILDLAGIEYECEGMHGRSLAPFLKDASPGDWRKAVYMQCNGVELYYSQRIIRTDDYKLVFNGYDREELYDLKNDPWEMKNLADDSAYSSLKDEMYKQLWLEASRIDDGIINGYFTVRMASRGPAAAFKSGIQ